MPDYFISARNISSATAFGDDPADTSYLIVPDDATALSPRQVVTQSAWLKAIIPTPTTARSGPNPQLMNTDLLIFIHGYNDSEDDILKNHRFLKSGLAHAGYTGQLISFDWPCGSTPLAYLGDRHKAKKTAMVLVDGGICLLADQQRNDCTINVHVIAHSTGAFVVREAFADAEDSNKLPISDWMVSQLVFISGDVSSSSMAAGSRESYAIYNHCVRFTNYSNPYDAALALSNVKRIGFENRVGRVGLPAIVPASAADVRCGDYYHTICSGKDLFYSHSWYFTDPVFMNDLYHTLTGLTDRNYMATRATANGVLNLVPPPDTA